MEICGKMLGHVVLGLIGQKIYKAVFKAKPPEKNELFQPGRMVSKF